MQFKFEIQIKRREKTLPSAMLPEGGGGKSVINFSF